MIRVDAVWLAVQPLDMRLGTKAALARVVRGSRATAVPLGKERALPVFALTSTPVDSQWSAMSA